MIPCRKRLCGEIQRDVAALLRMKKSSRTAKMRKNDFRNRNDDDLETFFGIPVNARDQKQGNSSEHGTLFQAEAYLQ